MQHTQETETSRQAVELDQTSVGRISRLDAIQSQELAIATHRQRGVEVSRIAGALQRLDYGCYGECKSCGEMIAVRRLEADPSTPLCIGCASRKNRVRRGSALPLASQLCQRNDADFMLTAATLRKNWALLAFGWLMTFGSAFGQTYFISIFGGFIRDEFALSHASFGTLYSTGALLSAFVLMWAGRLIDRLPLLTFSSFAVVGLALSTLIMWFANGWLALILSFFCLRFFGQGLMTHAAMTAMARHFTAERGRAVSFAALGHVCAEAVLPILAVTLMAALHWRTIWLACAAGLLTLFLPLIVVLLRQRSDEPRQYAATSAPSAGNRSPREGASLGTVLKDPLLYCLLPALMAPAFISTGLSSIKFTSARKRVGRSKFWLSGSQRLP